MKTIAAALTGLFLGGFFTTAAFALADRDGPRIGDVPPPLGLTKTLQGPPASEISWDKLRGKVVVLEFWATSCAPCVQAIPHLNELVEQFKNKPVVFISVTQENQDVVRAFLKSHPMKVWIGLDDDGVVDDAFHVVGIPHALIVDAAGHIAAIAHPAAINPENIEEVLAGKKCSLRAPEVYGRQPMTGIGLRLAIRHNTLEIDGVLPNTPAARAGLHRGMIIQKIDGADVVGEPLAACVAMIRGPAGSKVQLEVIDPAGTGTNTVKITRERFYIPVIAPGTVKPGPSQSLEPTGRQ